MQTIDLGDRRRARSTPRSASQAAAEGVVGHEAHIGALVDAALASPTVVRGRATHRTGASCTSASRSAGDRTLEGYVDLLYRARRRPRRRRLQDRPAGLDADLAPLVARYRAQGASYALAVAGATGEPVVDVVFVFLTPDGPVDRSLPDLPAAVAEVQPGRRGAAVTMTATRLAVEPPRGPTTGYRRPPCRPPMRPPPWPGWCPSCREAARPGPVRT